MKWRAIFDCKAPKALGKSDCALLTKSKDANLSLAAVYELPPDRIAQEFDLPEKLVNTLLETPVPTKPLEELAKKSIQLLPLNAPHFPQQLIRTLGDDCPPLLYAWGNLGLLNEPSVGFCGSRKTSSKGLDIVRDATLQLVEQKFAIISGHAAGVDITAHQTAVETGGKTIIVAPQGILAFKIQASLKKWANAQNLLILSEFFPTSAWSVGNAMARNKTIIGLSDAMILVESRLEGGTFDAGKTALKYNVPLYVVEYQDPPVGSEGNRYFIEHGAVAINRRRETNQANLTRLISQVVTKHRAT